MQIPRFVKAKTPKGLERAMLQNNMARKSWHNYQIVFDGKEWFAWYYVDLSGSYNEEIKELDGTSQINS
jgi:hypothetical protein